MNIHQKLIKLLRPRSRDREKQQQKQVQSIQHTDTNREHWTMSRASFKNNNNRLLLAILVAASASSCLVVVNCQFLPQSHLGRLVQSITSPLVLSSSSGYGDSDSDSGSGYYGGEAAGPAGAELSSASAANSGAEGGGSGAVNHYDGTKNSQASSSGLQQAPSQQRGVPTQHNNYYSGHDDERDQGSAPSNNKHTQDYQMGAYLGPSMDDKEINGAFNSNDDRDDDDGPASYDGPPSSPGFSAGRNRAAASNTYNNNNNIGGEGYGPDGSYGGGRGHPQMGVDNGYGAPSSGSANYGSSGYNDDDGADEDDTPTSGIGQGRRGGYRGMNPSSGAHSGYGRNGLSQAASQYQQQGSYRGNSPMMAAANSGGGGGFAGFGYGGGPVDLQGLMAGVSGDPSSGYQVYNGDGSYPGANYYQQQAQRGNRNQQAAASNGYFNNPNNQQQESNGALRGTQDGSKNEQDEHENEGDDD